MSHSRTVQSADPAGYIASAMPPTPRFDTSALRISRIPRIPIAVTVPETPAPDHHPPLCMREIERKFLVAEPPAALRGCHSALLVQGYLCHERGRGHVRIREVRDERYSGAERYLTVKRREGMARDEVNVPLSRESFEALWAFTAGHRLRKRRHYLPYRRLLIEVDVFEGVNAGIILAEVEFRDEAQALRFVPPAWFGMEVTKNPAYRNIALATE